MPWHANHAGGARMQLAPVVEEPVVVGQGCCSQVHVASRFWVEHPLSNEGVRLHSRIHPTDRPFSARQLRPTVRHAGLGVVPASEHYGLRGIVFYGPANNSTAR